MNANKFLESVPAWTEVVLDPPLLGGGGYLGAQSRLRTWATGDPLYVQVHTHAEGWTWERVQADHSISPA